MSGALRVDTPGEPAGSVKEAQGSPATRALLLTAAAAVALRVALELRYFRLDYDDFDYLLRATVDPFRPDESLRFLSVSLLFRGGVLLGAPPWFFATASAMAFAAMLLSLVTLLRRAGFSWREAGIAAGLWGLAPAPSYLLRWGAGLQQILGTGVLLFALAAADDALRARSRGAMLRGLLLAMALVVAGVFTKFPLMLLAPASCFLWSQLVSDPPPSLRRSLLCSAALAFAVGAPLLLAQPAVAMGDFEKVSGGRLAPNLHLALEYTQKALSDITFALVAVLVARILEVRLSGRSICEAIRAAWNVRRPLTAPVGRAQPFIFAIVFGAVWLAPFLTNGRYFAHYYLTLPLAPFAALAGRWLSFMLPARTSLAVLMVALAQALVFPRYELAPNVHEDERARIAAFLGALRDALRDRPEPARLVLVPDCQGHGDEEKLAAEDLHILIERMSGVAAIRWITGFHYIDATLTPDQTPPGRKVLTVRYCQGRPLRIEARQ